MTETEAEIRRHLGDLASELSEAERNFQYAVYDAQKSGFTAHIMGAWGNRRAVVEPTHSKDSR